MFNFPRALLILALALGVLAGCQKAASRVEHVFIVSLDQAAPFNIEASEMPVLKKMAAEGARTWEAYTIVPSLTLPAHVSMLTGVGPQKHQILWNEHDPQKGELRVPTVFSLAKERGLSTALIAAKGKFRTLQTGDAPDFFAIPEKTDASTITRVFTEQVGKLKPNLCFIHFADPDKMGHEFGVRSPEKKKALEDCDSALKSIVEAIEAAGLLPRSVIIVTSDHGGHDRTPEENEARKLKGEAYQPGTHGSALLDDVVIPWIVWGAGVRNNHSISAPVVTYDTAATALWLLDIPVPGGFWGRPVLEAFEPRR